MTAKNREKKGGDLVGPENLLGKQEWRRYAAPSMHLAQSHMHTLLQTTQPDSGGAWIAHK